MSAYAWQQDIDGIVTVTMDDPTSPVNTMNEHFTAAFGATVNRLEAERNGITGVILTSAKKSWFAGGDLRRLQAADPARAAEETARIDAVKALLRRIELLGKPVVAALTGTALGGGLEIALAAHHRIAASDVPGAQFGLPEVSLGLLPGGGGITRVVRMLGLQRALQDVILPARRFAAEDALAVGIVDEVAPLADLPARARAWIAANPAPVKPWDEKGFRLPGGAPTAPALAGLLPTLPATLRAQLNGAPLPAPRAAMAAAVEGAYVDVDTASLIETRYFVHLTHTPQAKNIISAFFDLQEVARGRGRPEGFQRWRPGKVGVVGPDRWGDALAHETAEAGIEFVRLCAASDVAESGRDAAIDLVIEADAEPALATGAPGRDGVPGAVLGSHTATLSVTLPSGEVGRAGIRFCTPVAGVSLVEIVRGEDTGDEVIARTFDVVRQLGRTPVVVGSGGFVLRGIATFLGEAAAAVGEGVEPASVEQAALQAGYRVGALQLQDELTFPVTRAIRRGTRAAGSSLPHPSEAVVDWMVDEAGRTGRAAGRGYYDYADGRRVGIWPGLREEFGSGRTRIPLQDLQERMLFAQALDAIDCLDTGVLSSAADADIGSLHGIGFPGWTGGVLRYVTRYEGGLPGFVARCRELAATYGERFAPPASLLARAETGEVYE